MVQWVRMLAYLVLKSGIEPSLPATQSASISSSQGLDLEFKLMPESLLPSTTSGLAALVMLYRSLGWRTDLATYQKDVNGRIGTTYHETSTPKSHHLESIGGCGMGTIGATPYHSTKGKSQQVSIEPDSSCSKYMGQSAFWDRASGISIVNQQFLSCHQRIPSSFRRVARSSLVACFGLIPCLVSSIWDIKFDMLFLYERSLLPLSTRVQVDRGVGGYVIRYVEFLFYQYDSPPLSERVSTLATVIIDLSCMKDYMPSFRQ